MTIEISMVLFSLLNFALIIFAVIFIFRGLTYFKKLNIKIEELEKRIAKLEKNKK